MRICILSQSRLEVAGGVETYIKSLSTWLSNHQQDVVVISRGLYKTKTSLENNQDKNIRVLRLPQAIYMLGLLISSFMAIPQVLKENHTQRIDVIHSVDSGYSGLAAVIASKLIGAPMCYSVHSHRRFLLSRYFKGFSGFWLASFDYSMERFVYSQANKLIVLDSNLRNYLLSYGVSPQRIVEIPVAIQTSSLDTAEKPDNKYNFLGVTKKDLLIGYVGRLEPEKNISVLLQSFKEALKETPNAYLILVGDGSLKNSLEDYAVTANISKNVRFVGTQHNISIWLSIFDIFVLPSKTEGMSIAFLEAMAAGKAIIGSDIAGIQNMIKHSSQTAILFDPDNSEQLKNAILLLCGDSQLRQSLGKNAKDAARQYDYNAVYPKMLQLYQQILSLTN
jgi:glycosyltransferase involved in cell wall biosynthesis